jgi:transcription-repair coupling factor (superfamily II helicase)
LLLVARFRARARQAGISEVTIAGRNVRFAPVPDLPESRVLRLSRLYPRSIVKSQVGTLLVPRPHAQTTGGSTGQATGRSTARSAAQVLGGRPIDGVALLEWARTVIDTVIDPDRAPSSPTSTTSRESS